ncbi:MAG: pyridoxal-phosphate dependent enzyme [Coriobacteriia bacterium]|nr:pyridoxal-phosphate dependent enzyme [Coriobacteriia bacterium]
MTILSGPSAHPIFSRCPAMREQLPHVPLGEFPTPVERHDRLARELGIGELWVKRDDLSGEIYGGNKVRKLEVLLADALRSGAHEVVTFGGAGSNHALATAIYGQRLGFRVDLFLTPQPTSDHVRRNLLLDHSFGAVMHHAEDAGAAMSDAAEYVASRTRETGVAPYVIPYGGTNALAVTGMMDAGLELVMQAFQGEISVPDVLFVAAGSLGTAVGIAIGLAAGECKAEVRAVRVTSAEVASRQVLDTLVEDARDLICAMDTSCVCTVDLAPRVRLVEDFYGAGYGTPMPEAEAAVARARALGLTLDGTYTGRAFAALMAEAATGALADKRVVFWDTFDSHDFTERLDGIEPAALPEMFARYFMGAQEPVAPALG